MIVTEIMELSKARCKVYIDEAFAFVLYKGELRIMEIKVGNEISKKDYDKIIDEVLPKRAKMRAMNLLKSREYTEHQLRNKLKSGFYPNAIIDSTLEYVKGYHYIDDTRYASQYLGWRQSSKSRKQIEQDLIKKGVSKEIIKQTFEEREDEMAECEEDLIRALLSKRNFNQEIATREEKAKTFAFLYRKGFKMDMIRKVIRDLPEDIMDN